jgi:hypothetical protein
VAHNMHGPTAVINSLVRKVVRAQWVDATLSRSLPAGVWKSKVFRGRWFRRGDVSRLWHFHSRLLKVSLVRFQFDVVLRRGAASEQAFESVSGALIALEKYREYREQEANQIFTPNDYQSNTG